MPQSRKAVLLKMARDLGRMRALDEQGLLKEATLQEWALRTIAPGVAGAAVAGPENRVEGAVGGMLLGHAGGRMSRNLAARAAGFGKHLNASKGMGGNASNWLRKGRRVSDVEKLVERGKIDKSILDMYRTLEAYKTPFQWAGRLAGGAGAGYGIKKFMDQSNMSPGGLRPAVSDMGTHYTGLTPDEYY